MVTAPRPWWRWLALGAGLLLLAGAGLLLFGLDPWLRGTLENKVAEGSRGRYQLAIGKLNSHLWSGTVALADVHLRTRSGTVADTAALPPITLDISQLRVVGVGLWAALRKQVVPIDSVSVSGVQLRLGALPRRSPSSAKPLYEQLPFELPGLRLGVISLRRMRARYGPLRQSVGQVERADATAHDVLLSAAGASDSQRIGYAAKVAGTMRGLLARVPGHVVQLRHAAFSSATQVFTLDSVRLVPLWAISHQRTPAIRADWDLTSLRLTGLAAPGLLHQQFHADSLVVRTARLAVRVPSKAPPPVHKLLAPLFPDFRLKHAMLTGQHLRVAGLELAPVVKNIRVQGTDIQVNAARASSAAFVYYGRAWVLSTGPALAHLDAPYYRVGYRALQADTRKGQLSMQTVAWSPTMSVDQLARRKGHQAAHVLGRVPQVRLVGFNFGALAHQGSLVAQRLELQNARLVTSSDGRFPINPKQSVATPEQLGKLTMRVDVRQVRVRDAGIRLLYRSPRSPQPGVLAFQQLNITLLNFSNDPRRMSSARPLTGQATGVFQKQCRMQAALRANLLDPAGTHSLAGTFSATPLDILNPMTVTTRGISIRSGQIHNVRFQMQLNRAQAQGTMWASYSDLKLDLLNRKNRRGLLHRAESSVVNGLFLRDNNPRKPGEALKTGSMNSGRELRFSVFTLWRQGIVSGMLNSAGVPAPLAKKLSEQN